MAIRTPELLARVPEKYKAPLAELHRRYDATEHVVVGGKNARLLDELGLTEFLGNFDTVAGTAEDIKRILDGLAERGVATFIANMPGHADKSGTLRRLSKLMVGSLPAIESAEAVLLFQRKGRPRLPVRATRSFYLKRTRPQRLPPRNEACGPRAARYRRWLCQNHPPPTCSECSTPHR